MIKHDTDTWQLCPHCHSNVHITKCWNYSPNPKDAPHHAEYEETSKELVKTAIQLSGGNSILSKIAGNILGVRAQKGVEQSLYVADQNFKSVKLRETICPKCYKKFKYKSDSLWKW